MSTSQHLESPSKPGESSSENPLRAQVRGSTLLLAGRGCSIVLNLITQILLIRYLSKQDYGGFAYAVSVIELASLSAALGMDKTFSRFGAIYHEQQDRPRFLGGILLAIGVSLCLGLVMIVGFALFGGPMAQHFDIDQPTMGVLMVLITLIPLNALSSLALNTFAVFGNTRTILIRKHLLGPFLKLASVVGVIAYGGGAMQIAGAFLIAGLCGIVADAIVLRQTLISHGYPLRELTACRSLIVPVREFFGYSIPLLSSDLTYLLRGTLIVILLGWLGTYEATASFRAILPVVRLNELVLLNFSLLFTPLASRLFAQQQTAALCDLYRRTSTWIMVLSFPVFAACVCLATPLTTLLFGAEYADAAPLLVILTSAYFLQSAIGFNSRMLKVLGFVWQTVATDLLAAAAVLVLCLVWIPGHGAAGATWACAAGIVVHSLLKSAVLYWYGVLEPIPRAIQRVYVVTLAVAVVLTVFGLAWPPGWAVGLTAAITSSLIVLFKSRAVLDVTTMFPETRHLGRIHRWFVTT